MPAGTQRYERTRVVLPLRVWTDERANGTQGPQLAHTIDISPAGGCLGGLRTELSPGQTITLQRGQQKAAFRVIWSKPLDDYENQAGVEAIEPGHSIWGAELAQPSVKNSIRQEAAVSKTPAPIPFRTIRPAPVRPQRGTRAITPASVPRGVLWAISLALFLLSGMISLSLYQEVFSDPGYVAVHFPLPGPPTADDLARLTPKIHAPRIVAQSTSLIPRVKVAEAPVGRIMYPVAPNDSVGGKVRLRIIVAADGRVEQVRVASGRQSLAEAAEEAVRLWRYRPFESNGIPAERETSVVINFRGMDAVSLKFPAGDKSQIKN